MQVWGHISYHIDFYGYNYTDWLIDWLCKIFRHPTGSRQSILTAQQGTPHIAYIWILKQTQSLSAISQYAVGDRRLFYGSDWSLWLSDNTNLLVEYRTPD